jgi:hypothetical protein
MGLLAGKLATRGTRTGRAAEKTLLGASLLALLALSVGLTITSPARATPSLSAMSGAEKLRRLDIMLMVTGLRCRAGGDNFNAEYGRFTTRHMAALNRANAELRGEMAARFGAAGANRALDRLSTTMANTYGQGHPWLSCHELKEVAEGLAAVRGDDVLVEAADQVLGARTSSRLAFLNR